MIFSSKLPAALDCLLFTRCADYDKPLPICGVKDGKKRFSEKAGVFVRARRFLIALGNRAHFLFRSHFMSSFVNCMSCKDHTTICDGGELLGSLRIASAVEDLPKYETAQKPVRVHGEAVATVRELPALGKARERPV